MAQLNKKKYLLSLEVAANNNRIIRDQTRDYLRTVKDGGIPEPIGYTIEEEEKDFALQRERAFGNLGSIMRRAEVNNVMEHLNDLGELVDFNRFFSQFSKDIKGQKEISALTFRDLWDRFKRKLAVSGNTGILFQDPEELSELTTQKTLLAIENLTGREREIVKSLEDSKKADIMKDAPAILGRITQLARLNKTGLYEKVWPILSTDEQKGGFFYQITPNMRDRGLIPMVTKTANANGKDYFVEPDKAKLIRRVIIEEFGVAIPEGALKVRKGRGKGRCCGKGIDVVPNQALNIHEKLIFKGYGKVSERPKKSRSDNYSSFGKYLIHLPSLYKGYLNIKYKTFKSIKNMPKRIISTKLKTIISHILQTGQFPTDMYETLSNKDKKVFDEVVEFVKLEGDNAVNFLNYKSSMSEERDKDVQRFELLRGELMAGNNNPVIIQELKLLVWKMCKDKNISKKDMNDTMYILAIL